MKTDKTTEPSFEQIAQRAYDLFMSEGCPVGRDTRHWLQAEAQLREELQMQAEAEGTPSKPQRSRDGRGIAGRVTGKQGPGKGKLRAAS